MKNINLKGVTAEAVINILIMLVAIINAGLQMFGCNTIPIADQSISGIVSLIFLIVTALYNAWKNRNITIASQKAQVITDAIKNGELLIENVDALIDTIKQNK